MIRSRRHLWVLVTAAAVAAALLALASAARGQAEPAVDRDARGIPYVAGELVVAYRAGANPAQVLNTVETRLGGITTAVEVEKDLPALGVQVLSVPAIQNRRSQERRQEALERVRRALERSPAVAAADYNYLRTPGWVPNDPRFREQWGHRKVGLPRAWDRARGGGVRIAVLDTGIAQGHPELRPKVVLQRDFVDGDGVAEDRDGHGTHVAGIAAAVTNNGQGVAGTCPACRLMVGRIVGPYGASVADGIEGMKWAADRGARVINLSLGGPGYVAAEARAVNYAWRRGAVIVAAAGNESTDTPIYPAAYGNAVAVAATNQKDGRARFSNFGSWVDISAPGVGILSTFPGGYRSLSGTSMAAPYVSGTAGLLAGRGYGKFQIRNRILDTAVDLGPRGKDPYYGHGRLNAAAAVR
ncbi:S8 family peptidase [Rubrobacter taiwanensis]|uniref:S8 family peptidase n=1 Tax=Rubrobacter taiwanensis TaxID=185139 RepID=UPI0014051BDC|nr:S8 family peptidase [Rubrobacter taiwanensis]